MNELFCCCSTYSLITSPTVWRKKYLMKRITYGNNCDSVRLTKVYFLQKTDCKDTLHLFNQCMTAFLPYVVPCGRLLFEQLPLFHCQNRCITVNHSRGLCDKEFVCIAHVLKQSGFVHCYIITSMESAS